MVSDASLLATRLTAARLARRRAAAKRVSMLVTWRCGIAGMADEQTMCDLCDMVIDRSLTMEDMRVLLPEMLYWRVRWELEEYSRVTGATVPGVRVEVMDGRRKDARRVAEFWREVLDSFR